MEPENGGYGIVKIDLSKIDGFHDVSSGYGLGRVFSRTKSHLEVLIHDSGLGTAIPRNAIELLK